MAILARLLLGIKGSEEGEVKEKISETVHLLTNDSRCRDQRFNYTPRGNTIKVSIHWDEESTFKEEQSASSPQEFKGCVAIVSIFEKIYRIHFLHNIRTNFLISYYLH